MMVPKCRALQVQLGEGSELGGLGPQGREALRNQAWEDKSRPRDSPDFFFVLTPCGVLGCVHTLPVSSHSSF